MPEFHFKRFQMLVLFILLCLIGLSKGKTFEEDLTLSAEERNAFDKFKELMIERLPHDYMKQDVYLIRWLRSRNFNIAAAESMLLDNLKWRKENGIDGILQEDWKDMDREYRYWLEGRDREGKPLLYVNAGLWDLRRAVITGRQQRFGRYIDKTLEDACSLVRDLGVKYQNVSQGILLINLDGFTVQQHACLRCVQLFLRILVQYETHHPGCADKIIVVNIPQAAEFVLTPARSLLLPETNKALRLFGTDKRRWQNALTEWFDRGYLPPELGGTKPYKGMDDLGDY